MENEIKKHIDSAKKKRVKDEVLLLGIDPKDKDSVTQIKNAVEPEYDYSSWLTSRLLKFNERSYFPQSAGEVDFYDLLILEVSYKQSFKSMCDLGHSLANDMLCDLGLDCDSASQYIAEIRSINTEFLDYYLLFKDEMSELGDALNLVELKIDDLADRSDQGLVISHAPKMTSPDCRYPKIYSCGHSIENGFLHTGNTEVNFDMHINAASLKVFKFVSLRYKGKSLRDYILSGEYSVLQSLFKVDKAKAENWVERFLPCVKEQDLRTSNLIRQIYFPVGDSYHLLSLLQPSGLIFSLKEKIDMINGRSPDSYLGNKIKKDGKICGPNFSSLLNLTVTKHGGDHPKNISGLNNKHQAYYLLSSAPPEIEKRNVHFPKINFFTESVRYYDFMDTFQALHKILKTDCNNINIREGRDYRLQEIVDRIIEIMWVIRSVSREQYHAETSQLKRHQEIWLCEEFSQEREESDKWFDTLCKEISQWVIRSYEKTMGRQMIKLGEAERVKIAEIVIQNREALR